MAVLPVSIASRVSDAESLLARALRHEDRLALGWPELEAALVGSRGSPQAGAARGAIPRGVIEVAAPQLHGSTSVALAVVRAAHARSDRAWCAWLDPEGTLYAPGVERAEVDRARLLVVRPPRADLGRIAVKVVGSGAFDVVVVDVDAIAGAPRAVEEGAGSARTRRSIRRQVPPEILVRKLAVAAEPSGTRVLLLTDSLAPRAIAWPVTMRIELEPSDESMRVRVTKDRRGRAGVAKIVPYDSRPQRLA
jgi:recombination protein RecA